MPRLETALKVIEIVPYLSRTVAREARAELGTSGAFTLTHLRVLAHARRQPDSSLGDLADARDVSLPTMSKMVSGLVEKGLLTRVQDPRDRRLVQINITPEGERLYLEILGRVQRRIAQLLRPTTAEEQDMISWALERLAALFAPEGEVRQHLPLPTTGEGEEP